MPFFVVEYGAQLNSVARNPHRFMVHNIFTAAGSRLRVSVTKAALVTLIDVMSYHRRGAGRRPAASYQPLQVVAVERTK